MITCYHCHNVFEKYKTEEKIFSNNVKHIEAFCPLCLRHIKYLPQGGEDILYFGKYKGCKIIDIVKKDRRYAQWLKENCKNTLKKKLEKYL